MMRLAKEVQRIVTSPYAVSLKGLHDILETTSTRELIQWASGNGCQIDALAAAVLDGLQLWPYTLGILTRLATLITFRDALLCRSPSMLDGLLNAAISSNREDGPAAAACISMLSHPLPETYGVPISFPRFLQYVLEKATEKPSAATMRPLYSLIKGGGSPLLSILPLDTITRLQEQLIKLLKGLEDHSASLLCLAIFARITHDHPAALLAIRDGTHNDDPYQSARQFFTAKRALKTLDLVVLRAILASSGSMAIPQAIESLQLAVEIINAVTPSEKMMWVEKNIAKLKKLVEKVSQPNIDHNVQLAALTVLASLTPMVYLPDALMATLEARLQNSDFGSAIHVCQSIGQTILWFSSAPCDLDSVIQTYAGRFSNSFVQSQIRKLLQIASYSYSTDRFLELQSARSFTSGLTRAIRNSPHLRQEILVTLTSSDLREPLEHFLSGTVEDQESITDHLRQDICPSVFEDTKRLLQHNICILIIKTALYSSSDASIDTSISTSLLAKAENLMNPVPKCRTFLPRQPQINLLSLSEVSQTPETSHSGGSWRDRLREELNREADLSHKTIVRIVDDTCRELEDRCNNIEVPLVKEKVRSSELQDQLDVARSKYTELERDAREQVSIIDALEDEKRSLADQVLLGEQQIAKLTEELDEMQKGLYQAKDEILTTKELASANTKQQELDYLAVLAGKEESIEELAFDLTAALANSKTLGAQVSHLESEASKAEEKASRLEVSLKKRELEMEEVKASAGRYKEDIERLLQREVEQTKEVESLKVEIQELLLNAKKAEVEWTEKVLNLQTIASHTHQNHANEIASKETEFTKQAHCYNESLSKLEAELNESKSQSLLHAQKQERIITDLEKKNRELNDERQERMKELTHAQDLRTKVMAVIGVLPDQLIPTRTKPRPAKRIDQTDVRVAEDLSPDNPSEYHESFGSSTSSRSGPTPKRSKPRRSSKPSATQQPRIGADFKTPKRVHGHMHKPAPAPAQEINLSSQDKENNMISETFDMDDLSFRNSDIFTSTDQEQGFGYQGHDETTVRYV